MEDFVCVIAGNANVSYRDVHALLDDYLPEINTLVLVSEKNSPGLNIVRIALSDLGRRVTEFPEEDLLQELCSYDSAALEVLVLGMENEEFIREALTRGLDVSDLSRALISVTEDDLAGGSPQMPLYGSQINANGLSWESGGTGWPEEKTPENGSQGRIGASGKISDNNGDEMTALIITHEERPYALPEVAEPPAETLRFLKNTRTGKLRRAVRAKPKPDEEETWLTQKDIDKLEKI